MHHRRDPDHRDQQVGRWYIAGEGQHRTVRKHDEASTLVESVRLRPPHSAHRNGDEQPTTDSVGRDGPSDGKAQPGQRGEKDQRDHVEPEDAKPNGDAVPQLHAQLCAFGRWQAGVEASLDRLGHAIEIERADCGRDRDEQPEGKQ